MDRTIPYGTTEPGLPPRGEIVANYMIHANLHMAADQDPPLRFARLGVQVRPRDQPTVLAFAFPRCRGSKADVAVLALAEPSSYQAFHDRFDDERLLRGLRPESSRESQHQIAAMHM
jgi:hypothetical protein